MFFFFSLGGNSGIARQFDFQNQGTLFFFNFFLFFSLFHLESFQITKIAFVFILKCFTEIDENICGLKRDFKVLLREIFDISFFIFLNGCLQ